MTEPTEKEILHQLQTVRHPVREGTITSLGLVSGLAIKDRMVQFLIEIDPDEAEIMEPVRQKAEKLIAGMPQVLSATAILTAEKPAPPAPAEDRASNRKAGEGIRHIVALASGKGGVGKSTTAVNFALALKSMGLNVGLLDADVFGPSQPRMMGIQGKPKSSDGKTLQPMEKYGIKVMSMGFLVSEDQPVVWRGPMVMGALQQMINDVAWGNLDILVVDMPPGTGDAQLTMSQNVPLAGAIIISTPQDIALLDARKGLNMFLKVDVPVLGIIENMSYFLCPSCGHQADIFGHGGAREEARRLACEFLGEIPLHMDIRTSADAGRPIVETVPDSPHSLIYKDIANRAWQILEQGAARAMPNISMR